MKSKLNTLANRYSEQTPYESNNKLISPVTYPRKMTMQKPVIQHIKLFYQLAAEMNENAERRRKAKEVLMDRYVTLRESEM